MVVCFIVTVCQLLDTVCGDQTPNCGRVKRQHRQSCWLERHDTAHRVLYPSWIKLRMQKLQNTWGENRIFIACRVVSSRWNPNSGIIIQTISIHPPQHPLPLSAQRVPGRGPQDSPDTAGFTFLGKMNDIVKNYSKDIKSSAVTMMLSCRAHPCK